MVPRAFLNGSSHAGLRFQYEEKEISPNTSRVYKKLTASKNPTTRPPVPSPAVPDISSKSPSSPVQIPQSSPKARPSSHFAGPASHTSSLARDFSQTDDTQSDSAAPLDSLLSATTIPRRRKPKGRKSQRLPAGDHVADFSKLLLEDIVETGSRTVVGSFSNPHFEELFGHSADKVSEWRSPPESVPIATPVSIRSMSSESMPSLLIDDDLTERSLNDLSSTSASTQRFSPDRRPRLLSTSEACGDDHPLQHVNVLDPLSPMHEDTIALPTSHKPPPTQKSRASSLRSNLTFSLRALRSAAQTVSSLASTPPTARPDDFLTRSIFSFAPELTDDKRPPPSDDLPSPALRRYLNPHRKTLEPRSPAELYSYNDYPTRSKTIGKKKGARSPSPPRPIKSIQLQTCIPSAVRSPNASSPPIWLTPDGTPTTHPDLTSSASSLSAPPPNLARQREPRENAAFLRILVAEMNMRRSGKFDEAMESHACVWLPPRKAVDAGQGVRVGRERWSVYIAG